MLVTLGPKSSIGLFASQDERITLESHEFGVSSVTFKAGAFMCLSQGGLELYFTLTLLEEANVASDPSY